MRNLEPYADSCWEFHKTVCEEKSTTKKDPGYKGRLSAMYPTVKSRFIEYDNNFDSNELKTLVAHGFDGDNKTDLHKLYRYRAPKIQELKNSVTTLAGNRILNTCQNCTINSVNSMDHFLPKDEFAEFVVNPKNLFPSCTECNSKKKDTDPEQYLNLYLDQLPSEQYLFVDWELKNNILIPTFYTENRSGIATATYSKIESHYSKLNLCNRFKENCSDRIESFRHTISSFFEELGREKVSSKLKEAITKDKSHFGSNYWVAILQEALLDSDDFWATIS